MPIGLVLCIALPTHAAFKVNRQTIKNITQYLIKTSLPVLNLAKRHPYLACAAAGTALAASLCVFSAPRRTTYSIIRSTGSTISKGLKSIIARIRSSKKSDPTGSNSGSSANATKPPQQTATTNWREGVAKNDIAAIEAIINHKIGVDNQDDRGFTQLHYAIIKGYVQVVHLLISHKANVNLPVNDGDKGNNFTPLHLAVRHPNMAIIDALLSAGANINGLCRNGRTPLHEVLAHEVATESKKAIIQKFIKAKADVNAGNSDCSPLHTTAELGDPELVQILLNAGAQVDAQSKEGKNTTPLTIAISHTLHSIMRTNEQNCSNTLEIIKLLIAKKANVNAVAETGNTLLQLAVRTGSTAAVQLLLTAGANVHETNNRKETALHTASYRVNKVNQTPEIIRALLVAGANADLQNDIGETPLDLADAETRATTEKLINELRRN